MAVSPEEFRREQLEVYKSARLHKFIAYCVK